MSEQISVSFNSPSSLELELFPYDKGNDYIYFGVNAYGVDKGLIDKQELRLAAVPHISSLNESTIYSYMSSDNFVDIPESGIYTYIYKAQSDININLIKPLIKITEYEWENTLYDLYWISRYNGVDTFNFNKSGVYSYPRNLKLNWITISGGFSSSSYVDYKVYFSGIYNEGADYGTEGPYALKIALSPFSYTNPPVVGLISGVPHTFSPNFEYYGSGASVSGIAFSLPYYLDDGVTPAEYFVRFAYHGLNGGNSTSVYTVVSHKSLKSNYLSRLDSYVSNNPDPSKLIYIDDIKIPKEVSPWRKRLAIGIQDISVNQNTYNKNGIYISNQKSLGYNMYSFTLRTDEFIPHYSNVSPYSVIKYFVNFGDGNWVRISPNNRDIEYDGDKKIPKLIVFDQQPVDYNVSLPLEYLPLENINSYKIKIVFDLSSVTDKNFIPPEVREYRCLISNRNKRFINEA